MPIFLFSRTYVYCVTNCLAERCNYVLTLVAFCNFLIVHSVLTKCLTRPRLSRKVMLWIFARSRSTFSYKNSLTNVQRHYWHISIWNLQSLPAFVPSSSLRLHFRSRHHFYPFTLSHLCRHPISRFLFYNSSFLSQCSPPPFFPNLSWQDNLPIRDRPRAISCIKFYENERALARAATTWPRLERHQRRETKAQTTKIVCSRPWLKFAYKKGFQRKKKVRAYSDGVKKSKLWCEANPSLDLWPNFPTSEIGKTWGTLRLFYLSCFPSLFSSTVHVCRAKSKRNDLWQAKWEERQARKCYVCDIQSSFAARFSLQLPSHYSWDCFRLLFALASSLFFVLPRIYGKVTLRRPTHLQEIQCENYFYEYLCWNIGHVIPSSILLSETGKANFHQATWVSKLAKQVWYTRSAKKLFGPVTRGYQRGAFSQFGLDC